MFKLFLFLSGIDCVRCCNVVFNGIGGKREHCTVKDRQSGGGRLLSPSLVRREKGTHWEKKEEQST